MTISVNTLAIAVSHDFNHDRETRYIQKMLYNEQPPEQKRDLPKIYETLQSDANIDCNHNKEEQPMAVGVTPTHANSWSG